MSIFGIFLLRIFLHSDWIQSDTEYLSVFSPNTGKYGPEKLRIRTLFTQYSLCDIRYFKEQYFDEFYLASIKDKGSCKKLYSFCRIESNYPSKYLRALISNISWLFFTVIIFMILFLLLTSLNGINLWRNPQNFLSLNLFKNAILK